jgi:glutamate/tyrosine decarboxylase-like PLP-dependent enzyme
MLLNPNNVLFEAGPITTALELEVGQDLCKMIEFENTEDIGGWGHLTCDGTVANIEAIWYVSDVLSRSADAQATIYRAGMVAYMLS